MDHREAIEHIALVEANASVNDAAALGIQLWPMVRRAVFGQLVHPHRDVMKRHTLTWDVVRRRAATRPVLSLEASPALGKRFQQDPQHDLLFVSDDRYHSDRIGGKHFNRHIDPLIDLVDDERSWLKAEIVEKSHAVQKPRARDTLLLHRGPENVPDGEIKVRSGLIVGFNELQSAVKRYSGIDLYEPFFVNQLVILNQLRRDWLELLMLVRPRLILMACYYSHPNLGMILAARSLGIPTVDVQHGKQGAYHAAYTHFTQTPEDGYTLLPDVFFMWGEESARNITRHLPAGVRRPRCVVGGNAWTGAWKGQELCVPDKRTEEFYQHLQEYDKRILVTWQPKLARMPEFLFEAMARAPENWIWLHRLHPLFTNMAGGIQAKLDEYNIVHAELKISTTAPLYGLLRRMNHHLSCFSSVVYESLSMGVPTAVLGEQGGELYRDYIEKDLFGYPRNADELLTRIEKVSPADVPPEETPYIVADSSFTRNALLELLSYDGVTATR